MKHCPSLMWWSFVIAENKKKCHLTRRLCEWRACVSYALTKVKLKLNENTKIEHISAASVKEAHVCATNETVWKYKTMKARVSRTPIN